MKGNPRFGNGCRGYRMHAPTISRIKAAALTLSRPPHISRVTFARAADGRFVLPGSGGRTSSCSGEHDPEKWNPVFGHDRAQEKNRIKKGRTPRY